jgi:hypothetical protein
MSEYVIINGHHPGCAYIRTLRWDDIPEECDCRDLVDGPDYDDLDDDFGGSDAE